jgi:type II secretory pathway pseudopilin PulG
MRISKKLVHGEQGFSLIDVLAAVTIISIISITVLGYFTAAMERSGDQNKQVIAANLARAKLAELREAIQGPAFIALYNGMLAEAGHKLRLTPSSLGGLSSDLASVFSLPAGHRLEPTVVNGTSYQYVIDFDWSEERMTELANEGGFTSTPVLPGIVHELIPVQVTAYWSEGENETPPESYSIKLDGYVVKGR